MTGLRDYIAAVKRELKGYEMKEYGDITINRVHIVYLFSEVERLEKERDKLKRELDAFAEITIDKKDAREKDDKIKELEFKGNWSRLLFKAFAGKIEELGHGESISAIEQRVRLVALGVREE